MNAATAAAHVESEPDAAKSTRAARVVGRPWKPGQSGNPNGRPKRIAELSQAVRDQLEPKALAELWIRVANDENAKMADRLEATRLLADRGWGKAADFKPLDEDALGLGDAVEAADRLAAEVVRLAPKP